MRARSTLAVLTAALTIGALTAFTPSFGGTWDLTQLELRFVV